MKPMYRATELVTAQRSILLISLDPEVFVRLLPHLGDVNFQVSTPADPKLAIRAMAETRFDLIISAYPLAGVSFTNFMDEVRGFGCPCRRSGLIVVARPAQLEEASSHLGLGLNRVLSTEESDDTVREAINTLVSVAPRIQLQAVVSISPETASKGQAIVTQTANISTTGMLVRHQGHLEVGMLVTFKLTLSSDSEAILGLGEVVRMTEPRREPIRGAAIRFIRLDDEGAVQLRNHIEIRLAQQ
jgi:hypothetical protein